jgi:hypothetical protein
MMDKATSVARSRFELFMKTLLAQECGESKEIVCGEERIRNQNMRICTVSNRVPDSIFILRLRAGAFAFLEGPLKTVHDLSAAYGKRKELFMLGEGLFQRRPVIDNDVSCAEVGFCKVTAVSPAENQDLIALTMKHNICFVNQDFFRHLPPP